MLKTRAITVTFRFYVALALAGVAGAITAALGSNTDDPVISRVVGPLSVGWKGGIGDHLAYSVLLGLAVVASFLAALFTAFRDADPSAEAQVVDLDEVPLTRAPIGANYGPVISVFGVITVLIGLALFVVVKAFNSFRRKQEKEPESSEKDVLVEIRDLLANRAS